MSYRLAPVDVMRALLAALGVAAFAALAVGGAGQAQVWAYAIVLAAPATSGIWWAWDAYAGARQAKKMVRFAKLSGWGFASATFAFRGKLASFPFGVGRDQRDVDVVSGHFGGVECASFTHQYDEGEDDRSKVTHSWQIDVAWLPYPLQTIDILPDDLLAKFEKLLGGQDIDFESAEFNREWRVRAGDAKYAHDIVHPRMMERLIEADAVGLAIRIEGSFVYVWAAERRGPEDLARRLGVATAVARLIPEFVYREFKEVWDRLAEEERKREEAAPDWAKTPYALSGGHYTGIGAEDYPEKVDWPIKRPPSPDGASPGA